MNMILAIPGTLERKISIKLQIDNFQRIPCEVGYNIILKFSIFVYSCTPILTKVMGLSSTSLLEKVLGLFLSLMIPQVTSTQQKAQTGSRRPTMYFMLRLLTDEQTSPLSLNPSLSSKCKTSMTMLQSSQMDHTL